MTIKEKEILDFMYYEDLKKDLKLDIQENVVSKAYSTIVKVTETSENYYSSVNLQLKLSEFDYDRPHNVWKLSELHQIPIVLYSDIEISKNTTSLCLDFPSCNIDKELVEVLDFCKSKNKTLWLEIHITNPIQNASMKSLINRALVLCLEEGLKLDNNKIQISKYLDFAALKNYFFGYVVKDTLIRDPHRIDSPRKELLLTFYYDNNNKVFKKFNLDSSSSNFLSLTNLVKILRSIKSS